MIILISSFAYRRRENYAENKKKRQVESRASDADPENEQQIQKAFEGLVKGKTVNMIAHRLSTIQDAHLILVMKQGELVESGTHDALVKQGGEYAKMWSNYTKTTKWHIGNEVKVC